MTGTLCTVLVLSSLAVHLGLFLLIVPLGAP